MVKITSKLYRPSDLLDVIEVTRKAMCITSDPKDVVIELRKMGYKIVKVDDGE